MQCLLKMDGKISGAPISGIPRTAKGGCHFASAVRCHGNAMGIIQAGGKCAAHYSAPGAPGISMTVLFPALFVR